MHDLDFWKNKWEKGEIAFHGAKPNLHLNYIKDLSPQKFMVPLCGKSLDMLWLKAQGHAVVGIELSTLACDAFFAENEIPYQKQTVNSFTIYEGSGITIWCGDFFQTDEKTWKGCTALYDRAALIALPPDLRPKYVQHILKNLGQIQTLLLETIDYQSPTLIGPPFSVSEKEVRSYYEKDFGIKKVFSEKDLEMTNRAGKFEGIQVQEEVFLMMKK